MGGSILSLFPDPPRQVFQSRSSAQNPRLKAWAPLCPALWATTALACLKEADAIMARRSEAVGATQPRKPADPEEPKKPPRKPRFPKPPKQEGRDTAWVLELSRLLGSDCPVSAGPCPNAGVFLGP